MGSALPLAARARVMPRRWPWFAAVLVALVVAGPGLSDERAAAQTEDAPTYRIQGTALYEDGSPLSGEQVHIAGTVEYSGQNTQGEVAADGTFTLEVPSGAYHFHFLPHVGSGCTVDGYDWTSESHTSFKSASSDGRATIVAQSEDISGIRLVLSREPLASNQFVKCYFLEPTISGIVTDTEGMPIEGLSIATRPRVQNHTMSTFGAQKTAPDGTFDLRVKRDVKADSHVLSVRVLRHSECTVSGHNDPDAQGVAAFPPPEEADIAGLHVTLSGPPRDEPGLVKCLFDSSPLQTQDRPITTELRPGWNLAGWTEGEAVVDVLFGALPELLVAHAWDATEQSFRTAYRLGAGIEGDLTQLSPGTGLWLFVGGEEQVQWTRLVVPGSGFHSLAAGWNLVVWAGKDGTPARHAFAPLGNALDTAFGWDPTTGQSLRYDRTSASSSNSLQHLNRGDAIWVEASSEREWLQPGGLRPPTE